MMNLRLVILVGCLAAPTNAFGQTTAEAEVLEAVQKVFDGISTGDSALLRSVMHSTATLIAVPDQGPPRVSSGNQFIERVAGASTTMLERMWDPVVHIDGPIASVWTPYDFYRGGEFSHCGIDAVQLVRDEGKWRVVIVTYTIHRTNCPPSPLGPPKH